MKAAMVLSIVWIGLCIPSLSKASDTPLETPHFIVSDATGKLSNEQVKRLGDLAQETLNRLLAFWSAAAMIGSWLC